MKIQEYRDLLAATLARARCTGPDGTPAGLAGQSILRMAAAYESDGRTFLANNDPVNALAAFLYGLGWLHCGIAAGLLGISGDRPGCPFTGPAERVPASQFVKLDEKTGRYSRLLSTAIASISPAPEKGTPAYAFALRIQLIADIYLQQGNRVIPAGKTEDGLACFSYGHGWIDAGVEAGLFVIRANREIFTVS